MNIQILLILSLVGFGATALLPNVVNGLTGGIDDFLDGLDLDLKIELKNKYQIFGKYVKDLYDNGHDFGKDKLENIKRIAKEFVGHASEVSKEVATEALEFMKPYKEDLGALWNELKDAVKEIINRND
ncbi:unnamed protein product [Caenorhabditis nigoni]